MDLYYVLMHLYCELSIIVMLSVFIVVDVPWLLLIVVFYLMIVLDICIFAVLCSDNEHLS